MDEGNVLLSSGSSFLIRSTTSMILVPGCRWMLTMIAGRKFIHAACLAFSVPSMTLATSDN